jgi:hypothetical protein
MQLLALRPNGPKVNSQGRQPLETMQAKRKAPTGRKYCRPVGALQCDFRLSRGSRPWLLTIAALRLLIACTCIILERAGVRVA